MLYKQKGDLQVITLNNKCVLKDTIYTFTQKTTEHLTEYCKNNMVCSLLNVEAKNIPKLSKDFLYLPKSKAILYLPLFKQVGNFNIMHSLIYTGNIFECDKNLFVVSDDNTIKPYNIKVRNITPHIEGVFGYDRDLNPITKIYPIVITDGNAHYHIICNYDNSTIQISPELPPRYLISDYQKTLSGIAKSIKPTSFPKVTQLSADVTLEIDSKGGEVK